MLKVRALNQFYGESHTLWDIDFDAPHGQCTCVMGRNGVGKTTLLQCIMGLLKIRSGSIEYDGRDISKLQAEQRAPHRHRLCTPRPADLSLNERRGESADRSARAPR